MNIAAICVGRPERLPGKSYRTGINKQPQTGAVSIDIEGIEGDAICNRKYHGGPDQSVYIEGGLTLQWWEKELGIPVTPGMFGENLVIDGLDNTKVAAGDRFLIGETVLEVTAPRMPCATFAARMNEPTFVKRYIAAARPGFYCRVLQSGQVSAGMDVVVMPYGGGRVTVQQMMKDFGKKISGDVLECYLAAPIHMKLRSSLQTGKVKF